MIDFIKIFFPSIVIGIFFGFVLEKSKVYLPSFIIGQMNLTSFIMVKVFFTAIATGALIMALLLCIGFIIDFTSYAYLRSIIGGSLMGIGVALAGACPGTVIVQLSAGYKKAIITIMGAFSGSVLYALYEYKILSFLGTKRCTHKSLYEVVDSKIVLEILIIIFIGVIVYNAVNSKEHKT